MAQERKSLGELGGEIVLDISPTADRQEWDRFMDLVEQAMKDNKDASGVTLFRWNSKDRFGRQIAASISGNVSGTFPHDTVSFDADFGWGLDRSPQR